VLTITYLTTYVSIKMTIEQWSVWWKATKKFLNSLRNKRKQYPVLICKEKAIPLQAWTSPESSRRMRHRDFQTMCTWMWLGCPPHAKAAITTQQISLVLTPVRGWVNSTDIQPSEGLSSYIWGNKVTTKRLELNFSSEHGRRISVMLLIAW
jgi:hypothetical protein